MNILGAPKYLIARVIRTDGLLIHEFNYSEKLDGTKYFEAWCDRNLFNIERVENSDKEVITYWVS